MTMNTYSESLEKARDILGSFDAIGDVCGGLSGTAIRKWRNRGKPPRTEYSGETNYASDIEKATNQEVLASSLKPALDVKKRRRK
jgi:hypothetical protein